MSGSGASDSGAGRAEPPSASRSSSPGLWLRVLRLLPGRGVASFRDAFDEFLEEGEGDASIDAGERQLLKNILRIGGYTARDVMVPRTDIVSLEVDTALEEAVTLMIGMPHSRYPVHRDTTDEILGMVHIKDVLRVMMEKRAGRGPLPLPDQPLAALCRPVLFVAPSMRALDLLLQMREKRHHMALVVDEYGGTDGLITIGGLVEEIVGEIQNEYDVDPGPRLHVLPDGVLDADARYEISAFEERFGPFLTEEEREEDIDTLGGLVFYLSGRIPARGEIIHHPSSGMDFEVMDVAPRRIRRLRITNPENPPSRRDS